MNGALMKLGFEPHPIGNYRYYVGDGVETLLKRVLPGEKLDGKIAAKYLALNREEYAERWNQNTKPYPGIVELLTALNQKDIPLAVLSNKPDDFTKLTVSELLSSARFDIVQGQKATMPIKPDPTAALQIAAELEIRPENFLYLGDTNTDMKTANAAGMYAVGVLWGFRAKDELMVSGAKAIVRHPCEILQFFNNSN